MHSLFICLLCLAGLARAEPVPAEAPALPLPAERAATASSQAAPLPALPLRARLDKEAIRAAIATTSDESGESAQSAVLPGGEKSTTLSAAPVKRFERDFAQARLPDCLHSEGLRNQPTFFMSGLLALPFIAVAKLRGVCR